MRLTPREEEVLRLVAEGWTAVAIAARLGISDKTAETHRLRACEKLGLEGRRAIIRYAIAQGWFHEPVPTDA